MEKRIWFVLVIIICALVWGTGCSKDDAEKQWGANCYVYMDNLPEEYGELPAEVRENTKVWLSLENVAVGKTYKVELTEENGYEEKIELLPGTYAISQVYFGNDVLIAIDAWTEVSSVTVEKEGETLLPVFISQPEELAAWIQQTRPGEIILAEALYSRKVQWDGAVYDIQQLPSVIDFTVGGEKSVASGDIAFLSSDSQKGVVMIVQNTDAQKSMPASQCQCVGFRFDHINASLPTGLQVGASVKDIAHAQTGLLGTPDYCQGTPFVGMGLDDTSLIYIDKSSGDRITLELDTYTGSVQSITYEFQRYQ